MDSIEEMRNFGEQLRQIREAQELTIDQVSSVTHIRRGIIEQIERGELDTIGAPVYTRGFIRTYCNILEADDIWKKYSTRLSLLAPDMSDIDDGVSTADMTVERPVKRSGSPILVYIVLLLAAVGAGAFLWTQLNAPQGDGSGFFLKTTLPLSHPQDNEQTAPAISEDIISDDMPQATQIESEDVATLSIDISVDLISQVNDALPTIISDEATASSAETALPAMPASADRRLTINIHSPLRLVVQQGQKVTTRRNLDSGSVRKYTVRSETPVSMSVGNAASITWMDQTYSPAGRGTGPLGLIFYPDGSVKLVEGESDHFKSE